MNATTCSTPGAFKLSYSAKTRIVSKRTTDLSSPFLSRSSVCLACRQETGFRVSVHSRGSWGNVEKGWGFWGFHKRGSRNLFETILHKQTPIQRVWNQPALSLNDQIYVAWVSVCSTWTKKRRLFCDQTAQNSMSQEPFKISWSKPQAEISIRELWTICLAKHSIQKPQNTLLFIFKYFVRGVAVWWHDILLYNISLAVFNSSVS